MERKAVARSMATAATVAGLIFSAWSSHANAASTTYHGLDVAMLRSNASLTQGPAGSDMIDPNLLAPRIESKESTKGGKAETKGTKGTGSKSKARGSATGTSSKSKAATKSGTQSASQHAAQAASNNTNSASKQRGSATGTNSASKHEAAPATTTQGTSATTAGAQNVLGVQQAPMGSANNAVSGQQQPGITGVVAGVQNLPSTSTAALGLAGAGLALASAGSALIIRRRRPR